VPVIDRERVIAALPGYTVGEEIGGGGSGTVLAGHHVDLDRAVAIKVLSTPTENPAAVNGFRAEARLLSRLDHPHIVRIHDFVARDDVFLLVMEMLPGGSLGRRELSMPGVCAVGLAVADALSRAHGLGVLHRDIKPDNILFSRFGQPKLTDFGIAKIFDFSSDVASRVVGSPRYMAPEQIARDRLIPATDIYALGVVLYELFAGGPLFGADLPLPRLLAAHAEVVPAPPAGLPEPLARVVLHALAKSPADRPGSAGAFALELAAAAQTVFGPRWLGLAGVPVQVSDDFRDHPAPGGAPTGQVTHRSAGPMAPPAPSERPGAGHPGSGARVGVGVGVGSGPGAGYPPDPVTHLGVARPGDAPPAAGPGAAGPGAAGPGAPAGPVVSGNARRPDLPAPPPPPVEPGPGGFRPGGYRPGEGPAPEPSASRRTGGTGGAALRRWWPVAAAVVVVLAVVLYLVIPGGSGSPSPRPTAAAPLTAAPVPPNAEGQAQLPPTYDSLAVDAAGTIYLASWQDDQIEKIDAKRNLTVVAGTGAKGSSGDGGPALAATLGGPKAAVADNRGNVYLADEGNHRLRRIDPSGVITPFAGTGDMGRSSGDGGQATQATLSLSNPAMAVGSAGDVYFSDLYSVRRIDPAGKITTVVNRDNQNGSSGDGGPAANARLGQISGLAVDGAGNVYIADETANRIRKATPGGIITTLAGTGAKGFSGDDGPATAAALNGPAGVAVDGAGNVYIADNANARVRKVAPNGTITTLTGTGTYGSNNDDGPAVFAQIYGAEHVAVDGAGNVYVGETGRILRVDASGRISVIAVTP